MKPLQGQGDPVRHGGVGAAIVGQTNRLNQEGLVSVSLLHVDTAENIFPQTLRPGSPEARCHKTAKQKFHEKYSQGTWVAQSVKRQTSAQVMISPLVSLSPASGSVRTAQGLEPASDSVFPSLSVPPPLTLCVCVCVCVCVCMCVSPPFTKINIKRIIKPLPVSS